MSGLFQGDLVLKSTLDLIIKEMRENEWLVEDCFSSLLCDEFLSDSYGMKEINAAKEFIRNNNFPIYMKYRMDKEDVPCITIAMGSSQEDSSLSTLADLSVNTVDYQPEDINKTIPYILKPFSATYDKDSGILQLPAINEIEFVVAGQFVIDTESGNAYEILETMSDYRLRLEAGLKIKANEMAVIPKYPFFRARRERIITQEQYQIGIHTQDPSTLIFLYNILKYGLLRYREGLLERRGFDLSKLSFTDMVKNDAFSGDNVYSRFIMISGQVEEFWVKAPTRFIESVGFKLEGEAGIKIISKKRKYSESDEDNLLWETIDDDK